MITVADVKLYLGIDTLDTFDDESITQSVTAAVDYMNRARPDRDWRNPAGDERRGMIMLAARLYERRGATDTGQNTGYEFSGPIPLIGADLARLLGLDRFYGPVIA